MILIDLMKNENLCDLRRKYIKRIMSIFFILYNKYFALKYKLKFCTL